MTVHRLSTKSVSYLQNCSLSNKMPQLELFIRDRDQDVSGSISDSKIIIQNQNALFRRHTDQIDASDSYSEFEYTVF